MGTSFVESLNSHAGAIQALTAVILVVVTAWYAWLTRQLAKASVEADRPYVFIDLSGGGGLGLEFTVGNAGGRAAQDITFDVAVRGDDYLESQFRNLAAFASGLTYLAPGRSYRYSLFLQDLSIFHPKTADQHVIMKFTVAYREGGRRYSDAFELDLSALDGVLVSSFTDATASIARELRTIASVMRQGGSQARVRSLLRPQRTCPVCGERIAASARKCPHCQEWLPADGPARDATESGEGSPRP